jgi:hypothetical protein
VHHFWRSRLPWLAGLPDTRFQPFVDYDKRFLTWWGLSLFLFHLGSRRQLDYDLRDEETEVLGNANRLAHTEQDTLPVHKTLNHFLGHVGAAPYARGRRDLLRELIRMKALDDARLQRRFPVALDGTGWLCLTRRHCEHCLEQKQRGRTIYLHQVLEAKLVTPSGMALSMATEFIENPAGPPGRPYASEEERKQDCELKAFARLAPQLRADFPRTPLLITSDSLYGCGPAIQIAKNNGFSYIFTFKPGRTPALWKEFQSLQALCPENTLHVVHPDHTHCRYRWVNGLDYKDSEGRTHRPNALQCEETRDGVTRLFAWITDLPVTRLNVDALATKGGRIRWTIENQGFNTQKNSELNLEHAYSQNLEIAKAYYYLLQIAHILLQLLLFGSLLRRVAQTYGQAPLKLFGALKNIPRRLLEAFRCHGLPDAAFAPQTPLRIHLDTT